MQISEQRVLAVLADFDELGGASPGLVAWELFVADTAVSDVWVQAIKQSWIAPSDWDRVHDEQLWRLTHAGWTVYRHALPSSNST